MVALAALIALVLRVAFLLTPAGGLDGDEAVTGIMARRMAEGSDFYVFFPGQHYNGALEQYPQALLFALGLPVTPFVLRIPQLVMSVVACVLIYRVGLRLLPSVWHAVLAAVLFAFGPYHLIWKGSRSFGSYDAVLLVSLVTVLLAVRFDEQTGRRRALHAFGVGAGVGLTYYLSPSGYYLVLPAALWFFATGRRQLSMLAWSAAGFVAGMVPVLYWTVATGRFPTPDPGTPPDTTAMERFGNLFDEIGRQFIGVALRYGEPGWPVVLGKVTLWSLALAALVAIGARWRGLWDLLSARVRHRRPFDIVLLGIPIAIAAYVSSEAAFFTTEPRYLFTAYPILLLGLANLVPRRLPSGAVAAAAVLLFIAAPSLTFLVSRADDVAGESDDDLAQVVDLLEAEGTTFVYADYWTAMPLEFAAGDRLTVGTTLLPERLPEERRAVDRARDPVWVASRGVNIDAVSPTREMLEQAGIAHRERQFGDVHVFDRFDPRVRPWQIGLGLPSNE